MKKPFILSVLFVSLMVTTITGCSQKTVHTESSTMETVTIDFPKSEEKTTAEIPSPSYQLVRFDVTDKNESVYLNLPDTWSFQKSSEHFYDVYRESINIGKVVVNTKWEPDAEKEIVSSKIYAGRTVQQRKYTYKDGQICCTRLLQVIDIRDTIVQVNYRLEVDANEISETEMEQIQESARIRLNSCKSDGALVDNGQSSIHAAFVGNSFLDYSQVCCIVQHMAEQTDKTFVYKQFWNNEELENRSPGCFWDQVESGDFDIIFYCGFYSDTQVDLFQEIDDVCKKPGTRLVAFPAHNETESCYQTAYSNLDDIYLADWKGLLDNLIEEGVPTKLLYHEDYHKHSTEVAGYAGACLLYAMLYQQEPPSVYEQLLANNPQIYSYGVTKGGQEYLFKNMEKKACEWVGENVPTYEI